MLWIPVHMMRIQKAEEKTITKKFSLLAVGLLSGRV
jgi:hypothetical protein